MARHQSAAQAKSIVREFYDGFGWDKSEDELYRDTHEFEDLRPVLREYRHRTFMRIRGFLKPSGRYFLDAGSGPLPHPEILAVSSGYGRHVCVDFSLKALMGARAKLKDRGYYVLCDLTRLPFRSGVFDGVVSAHVLYHVPRDEQRSALAELHRTLRQGGTCVVVYVWPSKLQSLVRRCAGLERWLRRVLLSQRGNRPALYFFAHDYGWFRKTLPVAWDVDIRCWRLVDRFFTRWVVPSNRLGTLMMKGILWLETSYPRLTARVGRYPMIIIRK
jgi:SAM-dependent methyltransferase